MIETKHINELAKNIVGSLPPGIKTLGSDIEANIKSCVMAALQKMDLVTRDEFDAQTKVLQRTREKLEALSTEVAKLEQQQSDK